MEERIENLSCNMEKQKDKIREQEELLQIAKELNLTTRKEISDLHNKINFQKVEVEQRGEEIKQLYAQKKELLELKNKLMMDTSVMQRQLDLKNITQEFYEGEKNKEVERVTQEFEEYQHKVLRDQMFWEDLNSRLHLKMLQVDRLTKEVNGLKIENKEQALKIVEHESTISGLNWKFSNNEKKHRNVIDNYDRLQEEYNETSDALEQMTQEKEDIIEEKKKVEKELAEMQEKHNKLDHDYKTLEEKYQRFYVHTKENET